MLPPTDEMLEIRNIYEFMLLRFDMQWNPGVVNELFQGNISCIKPPSLQKLEMAVGNSERFSENQDVFSRTFWTLVIRKMRKITSTHEIQITC